MPFNQQAVETAAKEAVKLTSAEKRSAKVEKFTEQDMRQEILKSEMTLKDKTNKDVKVKTSDLVSAIIKDIGLTETNTSGQILQRVNGMEIKIGDITLKPGQFTVGSTNVAYIQIALGADPDGYFGRDTLIAAKSMDMVDTVNNASTTPENIGEVSINLLSQENFYDDFIALLGQPTADKYKNTYKIFNRDGTIYNLSVNNINIKMSYCYNAGQNLYQDIFIPITGIQNPNMNIDKAKFVKGIVEAIDKNEARLNYAQLKKSIEDGVKNIPANTLGNAQFEYIKANGWQNNSKFLDFAPTDVNSTGMTVNGDKLVVKYGTSTLTPAELDISKISTNNKFDQAKFIAELQKQSLTKLAKIWVEGLLAGYVNKADNYPLLTRPYNTLLFQKKIDDMKTWLTEAEAFAKKVNEKYQGLGSINLQTIQNKINVIKARIWLDDNYRVYKSFADTAHSQTEVVKKEDEFKATMTNVYAKKNVLGNDFASYLAGTYETLFRQYRYTAN